MTTRQITLALISLGLCLMAAFTPSDWARAMLVFAAGACAHRAYSEGDDE